MRLSEMVVEILVDEGVGPGLRQPRHHRAAARRRSWSASAAALRARPARGAAGLDGRRLRPRDRPYVVREPARRGRHRQRADRDAQRAAVANADGGARRSAGQPPPHPGPDALRRPRRTGHGGEQVGRGGAPQRRGAHPAAARLPGGGHPAMRDRCSSRCRWTCSRRRSPTGRRRAPGSSRRTREFNLDAAVKLLLSGRRPAVVAGDGVGRGEAVAELVRARRVARRDGLPRTDERPARLPDGPSVVRRHAGAREHPDPRAARPARRGTPRRRTRVRAAPLQPRAGRRARTPGSSRSTTTRRSSGATTPPRWAWSATSARSSPRWRDAVARDRRGATCCSTSAGCRPRCRLPAACSLPPGSPPAPSPRTCPPARCWWRRRSRPACCCAST